MDVRPPGGGSGAGEADPGVGSAPLAVAHARATAVRPRNHLDDRQAEAAARPAGAHYGIRAFDAGYETIVRDGNRGRNRSDGVLVGYSRTLTADDVGTYGGIPITSPERTLIDLAAHADPARPLREARRLKLVTPYSLAVSLEKHRTRRGTNRLKQLNDYYSGLPYSRCRSNAEAKALEVLHDAGAEPPCVNERFAGEEADLTWPDRMLIVEIDGPQFHRTKAEDARKQAIWEEAGYTVRRIGSDDVYARPELLIRLATGRSR